MTPPLGKGAGGLAGKEGCALRIIAPIPRERKNGSHLGEEVEDEAQQIQTHLEEGPRDKEVPASFS